MELNGTLLVQMIHFFIAYGVLRTYFFRPIIEVMHERTARQQEMERILALSACAVTRSQNMVDAEWRESQDQFRHMTPPLDQIRVSIFRDVAPEKKERELEHQEIVAMTETTRDYLVKRLHNVH
jgi:hypothetical protein